MGTDTPPGDVTYLTEDSRSIIDKLVELRRRGGAGQCRDVKQYDTAGKVIRVAFDSLILICSRLLVRHLGRLHLSRLNIDVMF